MFGPSINGVKVTLKSLIYIIVFVSTINIKIN